MPIGAQGSGRALAQLVADIGQHHLRALAHEQMRGRAAEAHQLALEGSRRAGQQRHLAPQSHPVLPFLLTIAGRMRHFARGLHGPVWAVKNVDRQTQK